MTTAAELPSCAGLDRRAQKWPLLEYAAIERRNNDRFIAFRGSMDFELAHYLVTQKEKENSAIDSPFKETYRRMLALTLLDNRDRILTFKHKAPPAKAFQNIAKDGASSKSRKPGRYIPRSPERILDAPQLLDDYYLNLLDWSATNVVSVALDDSVYMWHAAQGTVEELVTVEDIGPVTSINWTPDGRHIAVGLNNSTVQLWDSSSCRKIRTLRGHDARVGVLAWNDHILTTGGRDGLILNHDVRIRGSIVQTHRGHAQEVCGLKWSLSGKQLASGGNDNVLHIWDTRRSSSQYLHRLEEHQAAVKALAWCPFQSNLLASGGGFADRCIKFWNTDTGACLNSIDTHSQVCSLLWSKHERELLSSHGFSQNQLTLWKYSSMAKIAEFTGHTSRVLHLAQSPDGYTVVSAAADETLRFWKAFGASDAPKKTKGKEELLFKKFVTHIR